MSVPRKPIAMVFIIALALLIQSASARASDIETTRTISATFAFDAPTIQATPDGYTRILSGDLLRTVEPYQPVLPYRLVHLALPAEAKIRGISVETGEPISIPLSNEVELARPQAPISLGQSAEAAQYERYDADAIVYPSREYDLLSEQHLEGYRLLRLRIYPIRYYPYRQVISYVKLMWVTVQLDDAWPQTHHAPVGARPSSRVASLIDNPDDLASLTPDHTRRRSETQGHLVDPAFPCDYIIVTSRALHEAFEPLANWRRNQGLTVAIFDIEDVLSAYDIPQSSGSSDSATRLRQFLIEAYSVWANSAHPLRFVLLGGDSEIIPARQVFVRAGIYETSDSLPLVSDAYYAGLDGSWDADADGLYGEGDQAEGGTGQAGEEADLYAELFVGRAPVNEMSGSAIDLQARQWVAKVLAYEGNPSAEFLSHAVWLGEKLDNTTYGDDSIELTTSVAQALNIQRMYDSAAVWTSNNLASAMNTGVHIINHLGHASSTRALRMNGADVAALTNEQPFVVNSQGCLAAAFSTRAGEAIAEQFVTAEHGACAFIGNTSYGWYMPGGVNGASQIFDDAFFDALFRENIAQIGPALQDAKEDSLALVGAVGPERWVFLELTLLGDPCMPLAHRYAAPWIHVSTPSRTDRLAGLIPIVGNARAGQADGATFESYGLYWGANEHPEAWVEITPATSTPIEAGTLGIWDTGLLSDGPYTLRLIAQDTHGAQSVEDMVFRIDHTHLTQPRPNAYHRAANALPIVGTASWANWTQYQLDYAASSIPDTWIAITTSTTSVISDVLALWDTSVITQAGEYTLRLTVQGEAYASEDRVSLILDPSYAFGWPRSIPNRISNESLAIADLDGDGRIEIVASEGMRVCGGALEGGRCGGYGMGIYVWDTLGNLHSGWPRMPGSDNWLSTPALADLDGDETIEIIVGSVDGKVYAYRHDGTMAPGWPQSTLASVYNSPACGDIDGDGRAEVVACDGAGKVYAWSGDGIPLPNWPLDATDAGASPLLADLFGDPALEIVVADARGRISAWASNGSMVEGWPIETGARFLAAPSAGDLDGDGGLEIIAPAEDGFYVWRADGSQLPGWPQINAMGSQGSSPALADLDGDGTLEIIVAGRAGGVRAYRYSGEAMPGWEGYEPPASRSSPVVGDLDGDGDPEVIVVGDDAQPWVYAFHHDGSSAAGWPRRIPMRETPHPYWDRRTSATFADVDADGLLELAIGVERYVFLWDLAGAASDKAVWSTFRGNMQRSGGIGVAHRSRARYLPLICAINYTD